MKDIMDKNGWLELIGILEGIEEAMASLGSGEDDHGKIRVSLDALGLYKRRVRDAGYARLESIADALDNYLNREIDPAADEEALAVFGFALNSLIQNLRSAADENDPSLVNVGEIMEILGEKSVAPESISGTTDTANSSSSLETGDSERIFPDGASREEISTASSSDYARLERIVSNLGGRLSVHPDRGETGSFEIRFHGDACTVRRLETLLSSAAPDTSLASQLYEEDKGFAEVLHTIRDFMNALAAGDVQSARVILLLLANQQHQSGLYDEAGSVARDLHDSLKSFVGSLDSALQELVEDEITDSENRLERVLKHTEKAANTTLDHVEHMQERLRDDLIRIAQLRLLAGRFKVTGKAKDRINVIQDLLEELHRSARESRDDLVRIMTAQDYQDLTGQIIIKVMALLRDLELKLIKVISTFGFKVEYFHKPGDKEDVGSRIEGVVFSSQDDVDALLDELGF